MTAPHHWDSWDHEFYLSLDKDQIPDTAAALSRAQELPRLVFRGLTLLDLRTIEQGENAADLYPSFLVTDVVGDMGLCSYTVRGPYPKDGNLEDKRAFFAQMPMLELRRFVRACLKEARPGEEVEGN